MIEFIMPFAETIAMEYLSISVIELHKVVLT
jgi:hypothetical protein